mmetsp:Transcript_14660/g.40154  ORF Transcript_14660/g.40154 Transcript_14660/m.40154 type:complete len:210 (-) Transcript_14660:1258-1887(-)
MLIVLAPNSSMTPVWLSMNPQMRSRRGSKYSSKVVALRAPYSTKMDVSLRDVTNLKSAARKAPNMRTVHHSIQPFLAAAPCESAVPENHCRAKVTAPSTHRCWAPMKSVGALAMPKDNFLFTKCECLPTSTWSRLLAVSSILQLVWNCSRSMSCSLLLLSWSRTRLTRFSQMVSSSREGSSHIPLVPQELQPPQQFRIIALSLKNCALL